MGVINCFVINLGGRDFFTVGLGGGGRKFVLYISNRTPTPSPPHTAGNKRLVLYGEREGERQIFCFIAYIILQNLHEHLQRYIAIIYKMKRYNRIPHTDPDNNRIPHTDPDNNRIPHTDPDNNRIPHTDPDNNRIPHTDPDNNRIPHHGPYRSINN